jgi:hypothetical protein
MRKPLTPGTPVCHRIHPELVGRVDGRHEAFPTLNPPYAVDWDHPGLAACRLGPYYAFVFPEMLRPIGRLRRLYVGMRQGVLSALGTREEGLDPVSAAQEPLLMLIDGNETPEIVSDLDAEEINVVRSFITEIRRRHDRRGPSDAAARTAEGDR